MTASRGQNKSLTCNQPVSSNVREEPSRWPWTAPCPPGRDLRTCPQKPGTELPLPAKAAGSFLGLWHACPAAGAQASGPPGLQDHQADGELEAQTARIPSRASKARGLLRQHLVVRPRQGSWPPTDAHNPPERGISRSALSKHRAFSGPQNRCGLHLQSGNVAWKRSAPGGQLAGLPCSLWASAATTPGVVAASKAGLGHSLFSSGPQRRGVQIPPAAG